MGTGLDLFDGALLLGIVALGSYFQTITGFGLAMIVVGLGSGLGLSNIPLMATVVSIISLFNSALALRQQMHHISWPITNIVLLALLPSSVLGVLLLNYLSIKAQLLLTFLLGALIVYSGVIFALRPKKQAQPSRLFSFFNSGLIAGLCGGLFGMPGPPIIFHMYQQPFKLAAIRAMLLLVFAYTALIRTGYEMLVSGLPTGTWIVSALSLPCVIIATLGAQRFPPPLKAETVRKIAYISLIIIGLGLMGSSLTA